MPTTMQSPHVARFTRRAAAALLASALLALMPPLECRASALIFRIPVAEAPLEPQAGTVSICTPPSHREVHPKDAVLTSDSIVTAHRMPVAARLRRDAQATDAGAPYDAPPAPPSVLDLESIVKPAREYTISYDRYRAPRPALFLGALGATETPAEQLAQRVAAEQCRRYVDRCELEAYLGQFSEGYDPYARDDHFLLDSEFSQSFYWDFSKYLEEDRPAAASSVDAALERVSRSIDDGARQAVGALLAQLAKLEGRYEQLAATAYLGQAADGRPKAQPRVEYVTRNPGPASLGTLPQWSFAYGDPSEGQLPRMSSPSRSPFLARMSELARHGMDEISSRLASTGKFLKRAVDRMASSERADSSGGDRRAAERILPGTTRAR